MANTVKHSIDNTITAAEAHRMPAPPASLRSRAAALALAVGAVVAGGYTVLGSSAPLTDSGESVSFASSSSDIAAFSGADADTLAATVQVLNVTSTIDPGTVAQQLAKGKHFSEERAAREAALRRPLFSLPTHGVLTSTFGQRWGSLHSGIDIAAPIGTPIYAAADGVVVDSGPADGFGLWVRVKHADGTLTVYGHNDSNTVTVGQEVKAGDQIAFVGNRGFSTGPHVHFEVWLNGADKVDPIAWLSERGVNIFGDQS
jgi:murein DD-endopeptidase MepM/ murein hydrolase activator NlpD